MNDPTIEVLEHRTSKQYADRARIRVTGEGEFPTRPGRVPWCEISLWIDADRMSIGSFGGEVWPASWPAWFAPLPNSVQLGGCRHAIQPAAEKAIREALAAFAGTTIEP